MRWEQSSLLGLFTPGAAAPSRSAAAATAVPLLAPLGPGGLGLPLAALNLLGPLLLPLLAGAVLRGLLGALTGWRGTDPVESILAYPRPLSLLLTVILNTANFISTDGDLRDTLTLIQENEGTIPLSAHTGSAAPSSDTDTSAATAPTGDTSGAAPGDAQPPQDPGTPPSDAPQSARPNDRPRGPFTAETPYSTRYFVLRYDGDGDLIKADLDKIAAVTEDDVGEYLSLALEHGEGYGYARGYKYRVVYNGEDRWMAIFLDDYQEMRSVREIALVSLAAMAGTANAAVMAIDAMAVTILPRISCVELPFARICFLICSCDTVHRPRICLIT